MFELYFDSVNRRMKETVNFLFEWTNVIYQKIISSLIENPEQEA